MSTGANPRYANGHRRRRLRARVLAHYTHCALCGRLVDKTLPPGLPGSPEVHEIVPVSRGGDPLKWSNVALTHRACNQRQGNHLEGELAPPRLPTSKPVTSRGW